MANLTPRKEEVARIVAMLESTEFEDGPAMARAIIREVHSIFEERDWSALAWRDNPDGTGLSLAWGPFTSDTEAMRFAKRLDVGGVARTVTLYSVHAMMETIEAATAGKEKFCPNCGHPVGTHQHERQIGNCQVRGCKCKSMKKKED